MAGLALRVVILLRVGVIGVIRRVEAFIGHFDVFLERGSHGELVRYPRLLGFGIVHPNVRGSQKCVMFEEQAIKSKNMSQREDPIRGSRRPVDSREKRKSVDTSVPI